MKRALLAEASAIREQDRLHGPWPGREHVVAGGKLFVRETPATAPGAEPALYVHGLGGSAQNWTDLADILSDRLAGQAIDLPGFGHSEPIARHTIPALAQRIVAWIIHSGRGPVHLMGNSLGGAVTVYVAATRPQLVRTLTLISPAMPFADPRRSRQSRLVPLLALPRVDRLARRAMATITPERLVETVVENCWGDPERMPAQRRREAVDEARRRLAVPWNASAYVSTFRGLMGSFIQSLVPGSASLWRMAAGIQAPTLVVWGNRDRLVDVRLAPQVARTVPDSRLFILDGVGHVAMMETPGPVARAVVAMLDEVESRLADNVTN